MCGAIYRASGRWVAALDDVPVNLGAAGHADPCRVTDRLAAVRPGVHDARVSPVVIAVWKYAVLRSDAHLGTNGGQECAKRATR